jgi:hypothetical protein
MSAIIQIRMPDSTKSVWPPNISEIDAAAGQTSRKSRSKIHRARLPPMFCSELMRLSEHEPTQYQSSGIKISTGKLETHSGSPGLRWSSDQDRVKPTRNAGMFRIAVNLNGHGQKRNRSVESQPLESPKGRFRTAFRIQRPQPPKKMAMAV